VHELAVRADLLEDALGDGDPELVLDGECELEKVERVGGEIVGQRDVRGELLEADA